MRIRKQNDIIQTTSEDRQAIIIADIEELEEMYERGDIERHAYFLKKRALIRLL